MADTTNDTPAPTKNKLPTGDANPNSKASRLIRNAEFEELRADRDRLQRELNAIRDAETDKDEQGGTLNATRMRKILGQRPELDRGPLEKTLRDWLLKTPKDFISTLEDRERTERGDADVRAENARLKDEVQKLTAKYAPPEKDEGTENALALIERCLKDAIKTPDATCPKCRHQFQPKP